LTAWLIAHATFVAGDLAQRVLPLSVLGDGAVDADEVQLRLEIVESRLAVLGNGEVKAFIDRDPEHQAALTQLTGVVGELETLMPLIARPGMAAAILGKLTPLEGSLGRLAAAANHDGGEQVAEDQRQLLQLHWLFSAVSAGIILCGFALVALLFWQNKLLSRAHGELQTMADDLRVAKDSAEGASEAKTRFLANMSHELRTPLNAIIGFSEILSQEVLGPVGTPQYRDYAADILKSGRHMYELVSDILTMAKLDSGNFEPRLELLDLEAVVRSSVTMLLGTEMGSGRELVIQDGAEWQAMRADERALRQILLNVLSNALKFSAPETPVLVTCHHLLDGSLRLMVIDEGIGMTKEEARIAMEPFQQIDNGLAPQYEGTGLGLSIVRGLIERHGGRVVIDSETGKGTRIALIFPKELVVPEQLLHVA